jgi:hypothetical protein
MKNIILFYEKIGVDNKADYNRARGVKAGPQEHKKLPDALPAEQDDLTDIETALNPIKNSINQGGGQQPARGLYGRSAVIETVDPESGQPGRAGQGRGPPAPQLT